MHRLSIRDLELDGKRVLLRVDYNVPLKEDGSVLDDMRIRATLPTIEYLVNQNASVVIISHLGRPQGSRVDELSLQPVAKKLSELLNHPVGFVSDCVGPAAKEKVLALKPKEVLLLENLRFHPEEENPSLDEKFTKDLAALGAVYVNDAFGVSHRKHASVYNLPQQFPGQAACGFLMEKEIDYLSKILRTPPRPFFAIVGGAKVSTKIGVLEALLEKVDTLMIGGAMAYTFLKAMGKEVGDSLVEDEFVPVAAKAMKTAKEKAIHLLLPQDVLVSRSFKEPQDMKEVDVDQGISVGFEGVSIGSKTLQDWEAKLKVAGTIFWNGPLGVFEVEEFAQSTFDLARTLSKLEAVTIAGGGDSIAAIRQSGVADDFSHLSTGGGASLEYIEHGTLPGIEALDTV